MTGCLIVAYPDGCYCVFTSYRIQPYVSPWPVVWRGCLS